MTRTKAPGTWVRWRGHLGDDGVDHAQRLAASARVPVSLENRPLSGPLVGLATDAEAEDRGVRPRAADRYQVCPRDARGREVNAVATQHRRYVDQNLVDEPPAAGTGRPRRRRGLRGSCCPKRPVPWPPRPRCRRRGSGPPSAGVLRPADGSPRGQPVGASRSIRLRPGGRTPPSNIPAAPQRCACCYRNRASSGVTHTFGHRHRTVTALSLRRSCRIEPATSS